MTPLGVIEIQLSREQLELLAERIAAHLTGDHDPHELPPPRLSEPEAAAMFSVEPHVLRDARKRGELEYHKIGKFVRYDRKQLEAWKLSRRKKP